MSILDLARAGGTLEGASIWNNRNTARRVGPELGRRGKAFCRPPRNPYFTDEGVFTQETAIIRAVFLKPPFCSGQARSYPGEEPLWVLEVCQDKIWL